MDHDTPLDRRHPRVGVHDLRRDLRDADYDRFRLAAALEQQRRSRTTSNRLLGAMIIVAGGFTSGLWFTLPTRLHAVAQRPVEAPSVANPDAVTADVARTEPLAATALPVMSVPVQPEPPAVGSAGVARSSPPTVVRRQRRPAPTTAAAGGRGQIDTERRPSSGRAASVRRSRPRPLSPGEFGRQARL